MQQVKKTFEKVFWLLLLASPLLDMANGIWTYFRCGGDGGMLSSLDITEIPGMSPSFLIRMCFMLLMIAYVFLNKNWRAVCMFVGIGVPWVLTVAYEYFRGAEFSLSADIQYIVRFCYCLLVLIVYATMLKQDGRSSQQLKRNIDRAICVSLLVLGLGVLVPYIFGVGFYTYADPLGYRGSRGFFYAGNDITAVMMLLLPVTFAGWLQQKQVRRPCLAWLQAAAAALGFLALLIIGTKTAFLAAGVTLVVLAVYALITGFTRHDWGPLLRGLAVVLLVLLLLGLMMLICETSPLETIWRSLSATGEHMETADTETVIFSGRTSKLDAALDDFKAALPLSAVVGVGRGSQALIVEMDLVEVVLYYGLLGAVAMLWLYLTQGIQIILDLFRNFSLTALACCVSLGLCVGYLTMAGHTLFSVTAGFYFAFVIVYARMFCSKNGLETKIL